MATLYDVDERIEQLMEKSVDMETGEVAEGFIEQLESLQMERNEKLDNILCYIINLNAEAKMHEEQEQKQRKMKTTAKNKAEWLKGYLTRHMEAGVEKFTSAHGSISWRKSEKIIVEDVASLPTEYLRVDIKADLTALKKALKENIQIGGVTLEERQNIQIK